MTMKAYCATFKAADGKDELKAVWGNSLAQAARKASELENEKLELVKVELDEEVII